jgi:Flp pilus assembly protein TadD
VRADWPELLKVTSIAGQHLLSVIDGTVVSEREKRAVAGEILTMMQEMLRYSHQDQHDAILLMVADIHQQIGVLDLAQSYSADTTADGSSDQQGHVRAALHHFQLALDVTSGIAEKAGQHLLVAPLTLTANALASLGAFPSAFEKYGRALELNGRHLGPGHPSNVPLLVDFGISLLHGGDCARAAETFDRAELLMADAGTPHNSAMQQRLLEYRGKVTIKCGY